MSTALLIVFCWAAAAETAFALFYGFFFPWYRSELGRQMFIYSATVAAIMDLALLARFDLVSSRWVFLAGYGTLAAVITWRLVILGRMWWQQHRT